MSEKETSAVVISIEVPVPEGNFHVGGCYLYYSSSIEDPDKCFVGIISNLSYLETKGLLAEISSTYNGSERDDC